MADLTLRSLDPNDPPLTFEQANNNFLFVQEQALAAQQSAQDAQDSAQDAQDIVDGLGFELSDISHRIRNLQYGDGPYPSLDLLFTGAEQIDPRLVFTRASGAWRWNERGILVPEAADVPRIQYDPATGECRGLLVEGQATNLILHSEFENGKSDLVGASSQDSPAMEAGGPMWSFSNSIRVIPENALANIIECRLTAGSAALNTDHTLSLFIETEDESEFTLGSRSSSDANATPLLFNQDAASYSVRRLGSRRFQVIAIGQRNAFNNAFGLLVTTTHKRNPFRVSGYSLYEGAHTFDSLPSYIPTEASQVTRAADSVHILTEDIPGFDPQRGTLLADGAVLGYGAQGFMARVHQASDRYIATGYCVSTGVGRSAYMRNGGSSVFAIAPGGYIAYSTRAISAVAWDGGNFVNAANGSVSSISSQPDGPPLTPTDIRLAVTTTGAFGSPTLIRRVLYYPRALSEAQLIALTEVA